MLVVKRLGENSYSVSAPLDGFEAVAATVREAVTHLRTTMAIHGMVKERLHKLRKLTKVSFDPQRRCYVAVCQATGLGAEGFTRQDATDNLYRAMQLVEEARTAALALGTQGQTNGEDSTAAEPETE